MTLIIIILLIIIFSPIIALILAVGRAFDKSTQASTEHRLKLQRAAEIHEARLAREQNAIVLQDLMIEKIRKDIEPPPGFTPLDYHS